ncbi:hypothetical protein [Arthrobacter roseus]|uniref:hypothetical protein n=1 Tax=Arthrobacter roseus TaxID=136274 RepID=UPI001965F11E|nr:hypothetical protein [Arthrobacter roseus]MBM7847626.1 hypothetical protein [Arthrobacter roseus]
MSTEEDATQDAMVQEDLNKLLGTALGMAQDQLETHGAFLPTALIVDNTGEVRMVAVSPEDDGKDLDADSMIEDLYEALKQQRNENRAAAVVSDIHLPDENSDAIYVVAEHSTSVAIAAIQPYGEEGGQWSYKDPIWESADITVWGQ